MSWLTNFLSSSIGRKLIMSLTGLFLCLFLVIHCAGNMQLLFNDCGESFNLYTKKMTSSPLIKLVSYFTYFFILLHAIQGVMLALRNRSARPVKYAVSAGSKNSSFASRNMAVLGSIIFIFLVIHLKSFWFEMKFGHIPKITYDGHEYKNLYKIVAAAFSQWWYVVLYVASLIALAYHLLHGFQSAFQSLGINHNKYTPIIKTVGWLFAILIPLGFALQPLYMLLNSQNIINNCGL